MKTIGYIFLIFGFLVTSVLFNGCKKTDDENNNVCVITSPSNGQEIAWGEVVTVSVDVNDVSGNVYEVRFYVDGVGKSAVSSFPFNYEWNTASSYLGSHTLKASSIGYSGVLGSDEISITLVDGTPGDYSPVAGFTSDVTTGEAPLIVSFTDQSTNNPTSWYWEFGDGATSEVQNPVHTFTATGFYSVMLIVVNEYGSDTLTKSNVINVGGTGGGNPCPGTPTVTDADGNVYNTVQIGGQCWMRENLRVGTQINGNTEMTNNSIIEKYCYDDDPENCDAFGGMYQWDEVMNYSEQEGSQGICPDGWHIPTDEDWQFLEIHIGMSQSEADLTGWRGTSEGDKLKSEIGWEADGNGSNTSGFTAYPGGVRSGSSLEFHELGSLGFWWTSSKYDETFSWYRALSRYEPKVGREKNYIGGGISVRCVKNYVK